MKVHSLHAWIRRQGYLMRLATTFLTRITLPTGEPKGNDLKACRRYFGAVGIIVGILLSLVYTVSSWFFPYYLDIAITLAFALLLTGGLHEDGLADTVDGVGGGMTPEHRLDIMKDSRIGSYGAMALSSTMLLRFCALMALANFAYGIPIGLIVAASVSRVSATLMLSLLPYVRLNKSKIVSLSDSLPLRDAIFLVFTGVAVSILVAGPGAALLTIIGVIILIVGMRTWLRRRLGGFTGDTLGATQQITEILVYMLLYVWLQNNAV